MALNIGSNIPSLQTQRCLSESTSKLSKTYERLSSGQRIARASDDAAGLAIATGLNVSARVFGQGIRNVNDSLSVFALATAGAEQLTAISIRQQELAEQSANGTLSDKQREALAKEADQLTAEYNRIVSTTQFNGRSIFSATEGLRTQFGAGDKMSLSVDTGFGSGVSVLAGDLTLGASYVTGSSPADIQLTDINGDGNEDIVTADSGVAGSALSVRLATGDGSFGARVSYTGASWASKIMLADLNGDGSKDLISAGGSGTTEVKVNFNGGQGVFGAATNLALPVGSYGILVALTAADVDNDSDVDIFLADDTSNCVSIWTNDGAGSFGTATNFVLTGNIVDFALADLNNDNLPDLVTADTTASRLGVRLNAGGGNFNAANIYDATAAVGLVVADLNGDNRPELIANNIGGAFTINFNNGNGTFTGTTTYASFASPRVNAGDVNGDGDIDLVTVSGVYSNPGNGIFGAPTAIVGAMYQTLFDVDADNDLDIVAAGNRIMYNGGSGVFGSPVTFAVGTAYDNFAFADIDKDGKPDIASAIYGSGMVRLLTTAIEVPGSSAYVESVDLRSRSGALFALDSLSQRIAELVAYKGQLGAHESRLSSILQTLVSQRNEIVSASARIMDADIADETARSTAATIAVQIGSVLLGHAKLQPQLALSLLS